MTFPYDVERKASEIKRAEELKMMSPFSYFAVVGISLCISFTNVFAGEFEERVERLTLKYSDLWSQTPDSFPENALQSYDRSERTENSKRFQEFIEEIKKRGAFKDQGDLVQKSRAFLRDTFGLSEAHLDYMLTEEISEVMGAFEQRAREVAPELSDEDVFQALRNVWTMNGVQSLLGVEVVLTDSVFAYSMLYPLTDNLLDDPLISKSEKRAFNERFGHRLAGEVVRAENEREEKIFEMIGLIEGEFPRGRYPNVYESLLAIFRGQARSVSQQQPDLAPRAYNDPETFDPSRIDVVEVSFEKGGTSVLAHGYLVAGEISEAEAESLFAYGTVLQLVDDIQDAKEDLAKGHYTVFSYASRQSALWRGNDELDRETNRYLNYLFGVLFSEGFFPEEAFIPYKELVSMHLVMMVLETVATDWVNLEKTIWRRMSRRTYSIAYRRQIEQICPFSLYFLEMARQKGGSPQGLVMSLLFQAQ